MIVEGQDLEGKCADVIVLSADNRVLLLKRPLDDKLFPDKWCLPGGHRQDDESVVQAARRECREESGIFCNTLHRCFKWRYPDGFETVFFWAKEGSDITMAKASLSDEHVACDWVSIEDLPYMDLSGSLLEPLMKCIDLIKSEGGLNESYNLHFFG